MARKEIARKLYSVKDFESYSHIECYLMWEDGKPDMYGNAKEKGYYCRVYPTTRQNGIVSTDYKYGRCQLVKSATRQSKKSEESCKQWFSDKLDAYIRDVYKGKKVSGFNKNLYLCRADLLVDDGFEYYEVEAVDDEQAEGKANVYACKRNHLDGGSVEFCRKYDGYKYTLFDLSKEMTDWLDKAITLGLSRQSCINSICSDLFEKENGIWPIIGIIYDADTEENAELLEAEYRALYHKREEYV